MYYDVDTSKQCKKKKTKDDEERKMGKEKQLTSNHAMNRARSEEKNLFGRPLEAFETLDASSWTERERLQDSNILVGRTLH